MKHYHSEGFAFNTDMMKVTNVYRMTVLDLTGKRRGNGHPEEKQTHITMELNEEECTSDDTFLFSEYLLRDLQRKSSCNRLYKMICFKDIEVRFKYFKVSENVHLGYRSFLIGG